MSNEDIISLVVLLAVATLLVLLTMAYCTTMKEYPQCLGSRDPIFCVQVIKEMRKND